jgi:hypothetical protein
VHTKSTLGKSLGTILEFAGKSAVIVVQAASPGNEKRFSVASQFNKRDGEALQNRAR